MLGNASLYTSAPTRIAPQQDIVRTTPEAEVRQPTPPVRPDPAQVRETEPSARDGDRVTSLGRGTLVDANGLIVLQEQSGGDQSERAGRNPFAQQANAGDQGQGGAARSGAPVENSNSGNSAAGQAAPQDSSSELSPEEQEQVRELQARDAEVRAHEQAHASVGGSYASAPRYTFEQGPDGRSYAVGGHVSISTSAVEGDPQATIDKMSVVRRAALAPAEPSGQDRQVAAQADQTAQAARVQLREQQAEEAQASHTANSPEQTPGVDAPSQTDDAAPANDADETAAVRPSFAENDAAAESDALFGDTGAAPGLAGSDADDQDVASPTANQLLGQIGGLDLGQVGEGVRNLVGQASSFVASLIENGSEGVPERNDASQAQPGRERREGLGDAINSASGSGRAGGEQPGSINLTI